MSLLPPETIDVYRDTIDRVIEIYGFDVKLFIPKAQTVQQRETLDIYEEKPTLDESAKFEKSIDTKVFIEWKPDMKRLRRLGIFTEADLPIIAWFKNLEGLTRNAYIQIPINYQRGEWGTDEFELIDCVVKNTYNAIVVQAWSIAPRRQ